jgi:hypothetical protein
MLSALEPADELVCLAPWHPLGGFEAWDGSVTWARDQLLEQMDAGIDLVGVALDSTGAQDSDDRFERAVNLLRAAAELSEEGIRVPRLFPLLDTERIASRLGVPLDLETNAGRASFYAHAAAFYEAAEATADPRMLRSMLAHIDGRPAVALGPLGEATGADEAAILDFKARFAADFGSDCYLIADSESWQAPGSVDETTAVLHSKEHYAENGRHPAEGAVTATLTPGYWDPTGDPFYLARDEGAAYALAWQTLIDQGSAPRHVWINTWNDVAHGSGIVASTPTRYAASDTGSCASFVNTHQDAWGSDARQYIDVTRERGREFTYKPGLGADPVAADVPVRMRPGERRYVTVAMRNTGTELWTADHHKLGVTFSAAVRDFHLDDLGAFQTDPMVERYGGIAPGMTGVFTVLLTAPCTQGTQLIAFEIYDSRYGGFGSQFQLEISVEP